MRAFGQTAVLRVANILAQYHFYLVVFVTSSYLAQFVGEARVGLVFMGSSALTALLLYAAPPLFQAFGTRRVLTLLAFAEIAALVGMVLAQDAVTAIILVTAQSLICYAIFIGIDLLIEAVTVREGTTGNQRGLFLTFTNIAVFVATLSLSVIVTGDEYYRAFAAAALVMFPFVAMAHWFMPAISRATTSHAEGSVTAAFSASSNVRKISTAHLLLQIFFAWMGIYAPILLNAYELFTWSEIGIILAIAMTPYIVLEYPLGYIADRWLGEKELLTAGFVIVSGSLVAMTLLHTAGFWWWVGVMVASRIGAAMIEAMTEVHFFKQVNQSDSAVITTFRVLRPVGNIIGAAIASLFLIVVDLPYVFALGAFVMVLGIPLALSIKDSK